MNSMYIRIDISFFSNIAQSILPQYGGSLWTGQ